MPVGIDDLTSVSSSISKISDFFNTSRCYTVLKKVANAEVDAAYDILYRLDEFADERQALNRVLGHLESAHQLHRQSWYNTYSENMIGNTINALDGFFGARYRDMFVCCYIAILHKYLGESNNTIRHYLEQAEDAVTAKSCLDKMRNLDGLGKAGLLVNSAVAFTVGPLARIPLHSKHAASGKYGELIAMKEFVMAEQKTASTVKKLKMNLL